MAVLSIGIGASCVGAIEDSSTTGEASRQGPGSPADPIPDGKGGFLVPAGAFVPPEGELAATVGLRRLSTNQYDATVRTLLGDQSGIGSHSLPADQRKLFDASDLQENQISAKLISDVDYLAATLAANLVKDDARFGRVVGCDASQAGCLDRFVERFGRLALRHRLSPGEKEIYLAIPGATGRTGDFKKSVELIVSAFLQDPEFLHQIEIGTPVPGVPGLYKLGGYELASRLSYLLWGDMPSPALLDQVDQGGLSTADGVRAVAHAMLTDPRARDQAALFHQLWIGYADITNSGFSLAPDMKAETDALIGKVIFDDHLPWQDLFRSDQTFVTFELAQNYGLKTLPAGFKKGSKPAWVSYEGTPRRGIMAQTSVLRWGSKFGDTSPTKRGRQIRERLLCQPFQEPKAELLAMFKVTVDKAPKAVNGSLCKWDRYEANRNLSGACALCHNQLDFIGFGLENFDSIGRYRTEQYWTKDAAGLPIPAATGQGQRCDIRHDGNVDGKPFTSPTELADLLIGTGRMTDCALQQLYKFSSERGQLSDVDNQVIDRFKTYIGGNDFNLEDVLVKLVSSPAFAHRRMDQVN